MNDEEDPMILLMKLLAQGNKTKPVDIDTLGVLNEVHVGPPPYETLAIPA